MIKLFELEGDNIVPSEHCYNIKWLKAIIENYPDNYINIFSYIFYMACTSKENPYFNTAVDEREELIFRAVEQNFSTEDDLIVDALENAITLYETPTVRAYKSVSILLDNIGLYMRTATISAGRDGNITALVSAAKNFDNLRQSFKGVAKDLEDEQESRTRGGQSLGYDQM